MGKGYEVTVGSALGLTVATAQFHIHTVFQSGGGGGGGGGGVEDMLLPVHSRVSEINLVNT